MDVLADRVPLRCRAWGFEHLGKFGITIHWLKGCIQFQTNTCDSLEIESTICHLSLDIFGDVILTVVYLCGVCLGPTETGSVRLQDSDIILTLATLSFCKLRGTSALVMHGWPIVGRVGDSTTGVQPRPLSHPLPVGKLVLLNHLSERVWCGKSGSNRSSAATLAVYKSLPFPHVDWQQLRAS